MAIDLYFCVVCELRRMHDMAELDRPSQVSTRRSSGQCRNAYLECFCVLAVAFATQREVPVEAWGWLICPPRSGLCSHAMWRDETLAAECGRLLRKTRVLRELLRPGATSSTDSVISSTRWISMDPLRKLELRLFPPRFCQRTYELSGSGI